MVDFPAFSLAYDGNELSFNPVREPHFPPEVNQPGNQAQRGVNARQFYWIPSMMKHENLPVMLPRKERDFLSCPKRT